MEPLFGGVETAAERVCYLRKRYVAELMQQHDAALTQWQLFDGFEQARASGLATLCRIGSRRNTEYAEYGRDREAFLAVGDDGVVATSLQVVAPDIVGDTSSQVVKAASPRKASSP